MKPRWLLAALIVVLVAVDAQAVVPAPKVLGQKDSGRTVSLVPGRELQIRLKVCSSCGYHWAVARAPDRAVLVRLKQQRLPSSCQAPCMGGSETTIFRYRAKADGTTTLRLVYLPPGQQKPSKQFKLQVRVP